MVIQETGVTQETSSKVFPTRFLFTCYVVPNKREQGGKSEKNGKHVYAFIRELRVVTSSL